MQEIRHFNLRSTLIYSLIFHVLLIIIFSITIKKNPFEEIIEPVVVSLESLEDSMSEGLSQDLDAIQSSHLPIRNQPLNRDDATPILPDKALPVKNKMNSQDTKALEESLKKPDQNVAKNLLKQKVVAKTGPKIDPSQMDVTSTDQETKDLLTKQEKNIISDNNLSQVDEDITKILEEDGQQNNRNSESVPDSDPLKGADWSAAPRKTLFFPDIAAKIPEEYKKKGQNYIVKMRITFDKNGLAVKPN